MYFENVIVPLPIESELDNSRAISFAKSNGTACLKDKREQGQQSLPHDVYSPAIGIAHWHRPLHISWPTET
jgi:hypothetical protein